MLLVLAIIAVGTFVLAHTAPFPCALELAAGDRAVWRLPSHDGRARVFLTFDDGPNPAVTPYLLDALAEARVPATFFLIDRYVNADTAPIIRRMFDEGHDVALHSDTRKLMDQAPSRVAAALVTAADRIEHLAGRRPCPAFRPHAGFRSASMYDALARIDHVLVGWGWNLWDWNWFRAKTAASIAPRLAAGVSDGDIIVIHDGHHKNPRADRRYAVETVRLLVPRLHDRGFLFDRICDGLARRGASAGSRH
jgi:peptidoglycan/xylan/chitin deacetylase (PgdA/CDA1 family)